MPEVEAHITGTVWKIEVEVGDSVDEGDTVVILESMKMEMPVEAEDPGVVKEILVPGGSVGLRGRHARRPLLRANRRRLLIDEPAPHVARLRSPTRASAARWTTPSSTLRDNAAPSWTPAA